jgi:hypothetical protein
MFAQELARRGLAENGSVEGGPSAMERLKRAAGKAMPPGFAPDATPSATPRQDEIDNQLEKSRKLNAEGLEVRVLRRNRWTTDASAYPQALMRAERTRAGVPHPRGRAAEAGRHLLPGLWSVDRCDSGCGRVDILGTHASLPLLLPAHLLLSVVFASRMDCPARSSPAWAGTMQAFGSDFIHGGNASGPPAYLEPNELLNERTVDTMVPLQTPKTQADYYNY